MADARGSDALAAALERLAAGGALGHSPSRHGVLVMLGDERAVLVSFTRGRLKVRAYAPRDDKIEFLQLTSSKDEQPRRGSRR